MPTLILGRAIYWVIAESAGDATTGDRRGSAGLQATVCFGVLA
ncbi:hypothetical protein [Candidatus Nephthysia bennettiae]